MTALTIVPAADGDRTRIFERPVRELTDAEQTAVAQRLLVAEGVHVQPVMDIYHVLHLWALTPCTTEQEVRVIAAFRTATDCRLAWHGAEAR